STPFFRESRCAGSRWRLASATARNFLAAERQTSRISAAAVSGVTVMLPGKSAPKSATVKVTGGRIRAGTPFSLSFLAPRRAISVAITVSVERGRWGPCASVAPTGRMATGRSFIASSTSVQVISGITMLSVMAIEGGLPSLLSLACGSGIALRAGSLRLRGASEASPVDLTPIVLRQDRSELDRARILEGGQAGLHELLELPGQGKIAVSVARHHVCFGFDESVPVLISDHGAFRHPRVLEQAVFHLVRAHEDAGDLQHVVGPSFIPEEAALVAPHVVAGDHPVSAQDVLGLLVGLPVQDGRRLALDPERPGLARGNVAAVRVHDARLVPRDQTPQAARDHLARIVRDVDVEHL